MKNVLPAIDALHSLGQIAERGNVDATSGVRPAGWGDEVSGLIDVDGEVICRADLWSLAGEYKAGKVDVLRLFWTTMAWGGLARGRTRVIASVMTDPAESAKLLSRAAELSWNGHIREAHVAMLHRLSGLGPAFFTKFLWITGDPDSREPRCLILDDRTTVGYFVATNKPPLNGEKAGDYERYCVDVHSWAHGLGVTPDAVEAGLFNLGKQVGSIADWAMRLASGSKDVGLDIADVVRGVFHEER